MLDLRFAYYKNVLLTIKKTFWKLKHSIPPILQKRQQFAFTTFIFWKNNSICLVICNTKILLVVKFLETELKSVIARQQKAHSVKFTDTRDCTILLAFLCFLSYLRFERTLTVSQGDDDALVTLGKAIDYVNETESPFQPHIMVMSLENITTKHIPKLS